MQAIEQTPPSASASKITPVASDEAVAEAKTSAEAAAATKAANLESTLSGIDKMLLNMAVEETVAATEKAMATMLGKGKNVTEPPKSLGPPTVVLVHRTSDNPTGVPDHLTSSVSEFFTMPKSVSPAT
jgi:hypothetical protein